MAASYEHEMHNGQPDVQQTQGSMAQSATLWGRGLEVFFALPFAPGPTHSRLTAAQTAQTAKLTTNTMAPVTS